MSASKRDEELHVEQFAQLILEGKTQSDAYRTVFPKSQKWKPNSVHTEASKYRDKPEVVQRIAELRSKHMEKHDVRIEKIIQRLASLGYSDIGDMFDENHRLKKIQDIPLTARVCIHSVKTDAVGNILEMKLVDKVKSLHLLGISQGAFSQKLELSGPGGGPIEHEEVSDLDLAKWIAFKLKKAEKQLDKMNSK